jgi:hypothetical protein
MSKIYWQERNHPNWTGRVPRQSRITGEWSRNKPADKIPLIGYVIAVLAVGAFWLANFL